MVPGDRRGADRHYVPDGVTADISGVPVRLLDLSLIGARVEHEERFPLASPQMTIRWQGETVTLPVRVARSEIVGQREGKLVYNTGITIISSDSVAQGVIAAMLRAPDAPAVPSAPIPAPAAPVLPPPARPSLDDTWTRQVRFLKDDHDHDLPYAQFRLTSTGWEKEYVAAPVQPPDGFTIPRNRHDFHELQRTFEAADPDTRRMMQIALESQLARG